MASARNLELRQQVGQLLIMGFDGTSITASLRSMLNTIQPGGLILFKRNIVEAPQVHGLLREAQKASAIPLFRSVDMEGGTVDRFRDVIARIPSVADVSATATTRVYREHGKLIGSELRALGVNLDFAPCLDLAFDASKSVLGPRTVSADPEKAIAYARAFLRGLSEAGLMGCGKHFPGLGAGSLDSHAALPVIDKPWKRLWEEDLIPYRKLRRGLPFVMVCHAAYPAVTGDRTPASLSAKWMTAILRKKMGYRGIIVSDDLDMGGVLADASIEDAAVATIRAGADIALVCQKEESVWRAFEAVCRQAEADKRFARLIAERCRCVLQFKKTSRALKAPMAAKPSQKTVDNLRRKIWEFSEEVRLRGEAAGRDAL